MQNKEQPQQQKNMTNKESPWTRCQIKGMAQLTGRAKLIYELLNEKKKIYIYIYIHTYIHVIFNIK